MTPEQIKARCERWLNDQNNMVQRSAYGNIYPSQVMSLESLYREAMAAGLEMAARSCDREAGYDDERSFHAISFGEWCREQSNTLKEQL